MLLVIGGGCLIAAIVLSVALIKNTNVFLEDMYNGGNRHGIKDRTSRFKPDKEI